MPRTLFTADSHVGHKSILSARFGNPRPFPSIQAHDEALVTAWNASVRPDDIVWHLGDFAHKCSLDYAAGILTRLNGRKNLVRGNHDDGLGERLAWHGPVKCTVRADCRPPNIVSRKGAAASIAGDIASPASICTGRRTRMTAT